MIKVNTVDLFIPVQSFYNNLETFICSIWIHFIQTLSLFQWVKYAVPGNIIMKLHYWVHIQSYRFTLSLTICSESWYASCLTRITSLLFHKQRTTDIPPANCCVYTDYKKPILLSNWTWDFTNSHHSHPSLKQTQQLPGRIHDVGLNCLH